VEALQASLVVARSLGAMPPAMESQAFGLFPTAMEPAITSEHEPERL